MTTWVTVGLVPRTCVVAGPVCQDTNRFVTVHTDRGRARLSLAERPPGQPDRGGLVLDTHVRACLNRRRDEPWWDAADVLFSAGAGVGTAGQAGALLATHPGCAVYAYCHTASVIVLAVRVCDRSAIVYGLVEGRTGAEWCATAASAMHAWMASGLDPHALRAIAAADGSVVRFGSGFWLRG
ncbi:MAG TPA: hypothetical protein VGM10_06105 [Actinocrinis sp.]|jgi:hypothetical protein